MGVSYNGLWKLLIDHNMKKMDLIERVGISSSTLAKMSKGEIVSLAVLEKICAELDCDFGDLVSCKNTCMHNENKKDRSVNKKNITD